MMTIRTKRTSMGRVARESRLDARLTLHVADDTLQALAAWARTDGRTTAAQARHLIEQALAARGARLALTRR